MIPDIHKVSEVIRNVAVAEILPRFRRLVAGDISKKRAGDVVTAADLAAERALEAELQRLVPGSRIVGEERAELEPHQFDALRGDAPVWILDPIDGTQNFIHGTTRFAVIVALCINGKTQAGWIHAPMENETVWAVAGQGAWRGRTRVYVARPCPLEQMRGSAGTRTQRRVHAKAREGGPVPTMERYRCVGHEYMEVAAGSMHFARYGSPLKPWDHAAGALICREAGGVVALTEERGEYDPTAGVVTADLLVSTDPVSWRSLEELFADN